ncbi:hypothetical protein L1987_06817 [Smallanthus sonchifolius]|uniref:Uncharacterized protein n=1 Tax=Smallanthus sonchifolius TaxID=185202 RepID=A0ACB9JZF4_9ASTR|nr:hypothetical protein L1987_06817 [Smallanthus sonchifolius]
MLRDEDGRKASLKLKEKSSASVDNDVKMSDAEGSSNGSGESSKAALGGGAAFDKNAQVTGVYDLVAVLTHKGRSADSA